VEAQVREEAKMVTQEPIKLYPNTKIAGASDDVSRVYITQEYAFEGFTIIVDRVPAYRDNQTGVEYVPGGIAMFVSDAVMELVPQIQEEIARQASPPRSTWRRHFDAWSGGLLPA
jgi:hypothetical protein